MMKKFIIVTLLSITLLSNTVCSCGHIHNAQCQNKEHCHVCIQTRDKKDNDD